MNLENEFVPYEQALALKELGFDELCFGWYQHKLIVGKEYNILEFENCKNEESWITGNHCSAPTFSQAFKWFREKYNIDSTIQPTYSTKYQFRMFQVEIKTKVQIYGDYMGKEFKSYEEAELECLKNLILLLKKNEK